MKRLLLPILSTLFLMSCGPSKNDVILVNDTLVNKTTKIANAEKLFYEVCRTYNPEKISHELRMFSETCIAVQKEVEVIEVHKDLTKLKESTLILIKTYISTEKDYKEYARLYSIATADFTTDDEKLATATSTQINNSIDMAFAEFNFMQKEFANKYGYAIDKSKKTNKSLNKFKL